MPVRATHQALPARSRPRRAARILVACALLTTLSLLLTPAPAAAFPVQGDEADPRLPPPDEPGGAWSTSIIGWSVEGRPLEVFRFGQGPSVRLIIAGIHGGSEANTTALAHELIDHLTLHPEGVPSDLTLYVLPLLNPDGAARASGPEGRTNAHGVDLNRNWPSRWVAQWDRSGCWDLRPTTGGTAPASEPETASLIEFLLSSKVDALINYHSAALGIFPGGQPPEARSVALAEALAQVSDYPYPPVDPGCVFTGQLIDWAADHGIAAVDIELHNHRDTDLEINLAILEAFLDWRG